MPGRWSAYLSNLPTGAKVTLNFCDVKKNEPRDAAQVGQGGINGGSNTQSMLTRGLIRA